MRTEYFITGKGVGLMHRRIKDRILFLKSIGATLEQIYTILNKEEGKAGQPIFSFRSCQKIFHSKLINEIRLFDYKYYIKKHDNKIVTILLHHNIDIEIIAQIMRIPYNSLYKKYSNSNQLSN